MFGKRCTLCGGKLDSNNICMECGLDNNKSEQNYQINRSGCDDLPLTHVHRETEKEQRRRYPELRQRGQEEGRSIHNIKVRPSRDEVIIPRRI